jgi:hypothetical protein
VAVNSSDYLSAYERQVVEETTIFNHAAWYTGFIWLGLLTNCCWGAKPNCKVVSAGLSLT